MEPDDIPVQDLLGVGGDPEPGPHELRSIVARAGRKRWATAGLAATLALALGLGIGWATSSQSTAPASQTATAGPESGPGGATPAAASGSGTSSGTSGGGISSSSVLPRPISPERFTRLFTRTAGGTTIRGFLVTLPQIFALPASCQVRASYLQVEVSTAGMVGIVADGLPAADRPQSISAYSSQVVGTSEGDPTVVVTAATGSGVAKVSMSFAGGTRDAMAPVHGWVALAAPVASSLSYGATLGTVTAQDAAGKVLKAQPLRLGVESNQPPGSSCSIMCPQRPQTSAGPNSPAACPPLPCASVPGAPRVTVPPSETPSTSGSTAVNPGGPMIPSTGRGAAAYACPLPAAPAGGGSASSAASP